MKYLLLLLLCGCTTTKWMNEENVKERKAYEAEVKRVQAMQATNTDSHIVYSVPGRLWWSDPVYFRSGTDILEIGWRSDGTVVWRKKQP